VIAYRRHRPLWLSGYNLTSKSECALSMSSTRNNNVSIKLQKMDMLRELVHAMDMNSSSIQNAENAQIREMELGYGS
jgi:hypothetical protein